jgi:hypothetical protein
VRKALAISSVSRQRKPTLLAAEIAGQQWGVIAWRQLRGCGVTPSMAHRWRIDGKLHVIHTAVYALGHPSVSIEGRLVAALLHAGQDAVLSHAAAAWWWGLISHEPKAVDVSTQSWARSCPGVVVHHPRRIDRTRQRRFPITSIPQTLLDYAATAGLTEVRQALANADYQRLLDVQAVQLLLGQGRAGTATLRTALERHQPRLARTRSQLEVVFIPFCESGGIPLPEINVRVGAWPVDALWREERLVVELDGYRNHSTRGQMERDRQKDLELRAAGFLVIRYTWDQVVHQPGLVAADLLAGLAERRLKLGRAARGSSSTAPLA